MLDMKEELSRISTKAKEARMASVKGANKQAQDMDKLMGMIASLSAGMKGGQEEEVFGFGAKAPAVTDPKATSNLVLSPTKPRKKRVTSQTTPEGDMPRYLGF
jgi:hypothetical protein